MKETDEKNLTNLVKESDSILDAKIPQINQEEDKHEELKIDTQEKDGQMDYNSH